MVNIGIRVDSGAEHGFGHISRMNTLVKALRGISGNSITYFSKTPATWQSSLAPIFCDIQKYPGDESEWEILDDMEQGCEIIIIDRKDNYELKLLESIRKKGAKVVLIDMPWASPDECDLLVLPNIHSVPGVVDHLDELFGNKLVVGGSYVLIREDILGRIPVRYKRRENWIVFCAGGSDPEDCLEKMYYMSEGLSESLPNVRRVFCVGEGAKPFAPYSIDSKSWITGFDPFYLAVAALVVTLFGITAYECLYLETPCVTTGHTTQNNISSKFLEDATEGATLHLPMITNLMREDFVQVIQDLWMDFSKRKTMSYKCHEQIASDGAITVAECILRLVE